MAGRIYPKLSTRNIEAEILHEIQARRSQRHINALNKMGPSQDTNSLALLSSNNMYDVKDSFHRDFGVFEVTTCVANDGKQVVLVALEGRICLNGEPIRVLPDRKVVSSLGKADPTLQFYFDCAVAARNHGKNLNKDQARNITLNPGKDIQNTLCELNTAVAILTERHLCNYTSKRRSVFNRKKSARLYSEMTELVSLLNDLNDESALLITNYDDMDVQLYENERALLALVKAVKCFSNEAILSEPTKYTNTVHKDMYEKYTGVVKREKEMVAELQEFRAQNETLRIDKSILERKLNESNGENNEQMKEISALNEKNRLLSLNHSKSVSENLNLENQSGLLEEKLDEVRKKSKRDQRLTKDTVEKLRYVQKQLLKAKQENEKLTSDKDKTNESFHSLTSQSRQQDKSIKMLREERKRAERDRDRLIKVVQGALKDRDKMTSQLCEVTRSNNDLQQKLASRTVLNC